MAGLRDQFDQDYFAANYRHYERQNPARKLDYYHALLAEALPEGGRLLDMGCAFGRFLASCDARWQPHGFDPSLHAAAKAQDAACRARVCVASATALPFAGPFNAITAFDVIEHIDDLAAVKREVARALAPDGVFLFVVPVYDGPTGPIIRALDGDTTHVHKRARDFWLEWIADGFTVERWQGIYRYLLPGGYYAHMPTHALRRATPAIAVVARKQRA